MRRRYDAANLYNHDLAGWERSAETDAHLEAFNTCQLCPHFVCEIVSTSNSRNEKRDTQKKFKALARLGVQYYWMIYDRVPKVKALRLQLLRRIETHHRQLLR